MDAFVLGCCARMVTFDDTTGGLRIVCTLPHLSTRMQIKHEIDTKDLVTVGKRRAVSAETARSTVATSRARGSVCRYVQDVLSSVGL